MNSLIQPPSTGKATILLVDDCQDNREMYAVYLARKGLRVLEASLGREAVTESARSLPDLIIMDLSLPDMDGTEAINLIREDPRTHKTPIIVVSGYSGVEQIDPSSWDVFLPKPCTPDVLLSNILELLRQNASTP